MRLVEQPIISKSPIPISKKVSTKGVQTAVRRFPASVTSAANATEKWKLGPVFSRRPLSR